MQTRALIIATFMLVTSVSSYANDIVKKSNSGICHDTTSNFYERTKHFTAFDTMQACLSAGGRAPKSYKGPSKPNTDALHYSSDSYDRKTWKHWSDFDGDCQDTRAEVLIKQSLRPVTFSGGMFNKCRVTTGYWYDPYSDKHYTNDDDLDIDHIVPLAYAHSRGGSKWNPKRKEQFANDFDNLLAVKNSLNRQKSAKGPSEWMPPNHLYRCDYLRKFDSIMVKYNLTYFSSEKRVINKMKNACGWD